MRRKYLNKKRNCRVQRPANREFEQKLKFGLKKSQSAFLSDTNQKLVELS